MITSKKNRTIPSLWFSAILISMPMLAEAGETIIYPGNGVLTSINSQPNSLGPSGSNTGKSTSLSGNSITVDNGGTVGGFVLGAINRTDNNAVTNNRVTVNSGGTVVMEAYGGVSETSAAVSNNVVIIASGGQVRNVYGGRGESGDVIANSVAINGGTVSGIYGGSSFMGDATGNAVTLSSGTVNGNISGGNNFSGDATGNTVTLSGGLVADDIRGGNSNHGAVTNNTVTMSGGQVAGDIYGAKSFNGHVADNTITLSGGVIGGEVYGGYSDNNAATGNTVTVGNGSTVGGNVHGGWGVNGNADNNIVTINGGQMNQSVYGGGSIDGHAAGNTVTLRGGVIDGEVYGGYSGSGKATNNTVTLGGGTIGGSLYGGDSGGGADAFTGNTLNVKAKDLSVGGDLNNFQYLNFQVPSTATANATLLNVGGAANLTDGAGGSSFVSVAIAGGSSPLKAGDSITLIDAGTLTVNSNLNTKIQAKQGLSLQYDFDIVADIANNRLLATLPIDEKISVNPQSKALSEGRLAGVAFLNQGADIATSMGLQSMEMALDGCRRPGQSPDNCDRNSAAFSVIQGSSVRHDTGSHVDVDGLSFMVGVATRNALSFENLTAAAFIEAGWGNYDSYNSFSNATAVHGDGDTNYYGVGIMGKLDLANGLYADSTLRIGRVESDFKSGDLIDPVSGQSARYDSKSTYTGASLGLGKVIRLDEEKSLDLYTRYLWTHVNSDSINIFGDTFNLDAINSHRFKAGLRYTQQYSTSSSLYAGIAYDHEFDGDAKGSVYGYRLDAPSLEGGAGVFEVGMTLKPQNSDRLSVDMGLQGYVGQREGIAGSVKVKYAF